MYGDMGLSPCPSSLVIPAASAWKQQIGVAGDHVFSSRVHAGMCSEVVVMGSSVNLLQVQLWLHKSK